MRRPNIIPIAGNHEYMAVKVLKDLCVEITEEKVQAQVTVETMQRYTDWMLSGGNRMLKEYAASPSEKQKPLDYLKDFSLYEQAFVNGKNFLLVHGGLEPFRKGMTVEDFSVPQLLFSRANLNTTYFQDTLHHHRAYAYPIRSGKQGNCGQKEPPHLYRLRVGLWI